MASPVQLFSSFTGNENLFATPNFDEIRDVSNNDDFSYFDNMDSSSDPFLLNDGDYQSSRSSMQQHQQLREQVLDPLLAGTSSLNKSEPFGLSDNMFTASELWSPSSVVDDIDNEELFTKKRTSRGMHQNLPSLDTQMSFAGSNASQRYGQITPPMSSKSPEVELLPVSTSKRGRKPSAKAKKEAVLPSKQTKAPSRRGRKPTRVIPEEPPAEEEEEDDDDEEEGKTEESKAKRARFLERNRQAAYTCRQRKKQWARDLEDRHRSLERDNQNLKLVLGSLKDEYRYLRQRVVSHTTCECSGAREYIQRASKILETGEASPPADLPASSPRTDRAPLQTPALEQTLRDSLAHFGGEDSQGVDSFKAEIPEPEGTELDGMTL